MTNIIILLQILATMLIHADQILKMPQNFVFRGGKWLYVRCHIVYSRFTIDNYTYTLGPQDYVLRIVEDGEEQCISAFMGFDMPPSYGDFWIFGESMIFVYPVWNKKLIYNTLDYNNFFLG